MDGILKRRSFGVGLVIKEQAELRQTLVCYDSSLTAESRALSSSIFPQLGKSKSPPCRKKRDKDGAPLHAASVWIGRSSKEISTWSPTTVSDSRMVPVGSSRTEAACTRMAARRQGLRSSSMWMTIRSRSRYTASIGKRMAKVWIPREGLIHSPRPRAKWDELVAIRPRKRDQWVRAIRRSVAR